MFQRCSQSTRHGGEKRINCRTCCLVKTDNKRQRELLTLFLETFPVCGQILKSLNIQAKNELCTLVNSNKFLLLQQWIKLYSWIWKARILVKSFMGGVGHPPKKTKTKKQSNSSLLKPFYFNIPVTLGRRSTMNENLPFSPSSQQSTHPYWRY